MRILVALCALARRQPLLRQRSGRVRRALFVALRATDTRVRTDQREHRMIEARRRLEWLHLPVALLAVRAKRRKMHVFVARDALLLQAEEPAALRRLRSVR